MSKKDVPAFKAQIGCTESVMPIGKLDILIDLYLSFQPGTTSLIELDKRDRTWVLIAALKYNAPVILEDINLC